MLPSSAGWMRASEGSRRRTSTLQEAWLPSTQVRHPPQTGRPLDCSPPAPLLPPGHDSGGERGAGDSDAEAAAPHPRLSLHARFCPLALFVQNGGRRPLDDGGDALPRRQGLPGPWGRVGGRQGAPVQGPPTQAPSAAPGLLARHATPARRVGYGGEPVRQPAGVAGIPEHAGCLCTPILSLQAGLLDRVGAPSLGKHCSAAQGDPATDLADRQGGACDVFVVRDTQPALVVLLSR